MTELQPVEFRFSGLSSGYGSVKILEGLSGEFRPGTITTLIGPNGSGKSTFLRVLAGVHHYSGSLVLNGCEVRQFSRREFSKLVGVLPQQFYAAYPFSVREVIEMGRLPYRGLLFQGSEGDDERIIAAAELVGVEHLLFRGLTTLSGGETQRVLFAMVLAQDPPVFLLDEPTSALDPNHSSRLFSALRKLADGGKTVVAAVHDINASLAFSDSFMALKDGRIIFQGDAALMNGDILEALYGAPFCPYKSEKGDVLWRALSV